MNDVSALFHPKFQPLFDPKWSFVILRGGRASMKSWACARAALILGTQNRERVLCCRELQNSISESVLRLLSDQVEALGLSAFYNVQQNGIDGVNGTEMFFMGLRNDTQKVKSTERLKRAWVEEAQSVSQESLDTLIPTVLRNEGAQIWFSYNPRFEEDPIHKMAENPPPSTVVIDVNYRDAMEMGCFASALVPQIEHMKRTNPLMYEHVYEGKCVPSLSTALWSWDSIDHNRLPTDRVIEFGRVVVAVDPAVTANKHSDETGIIVGASSKGNPRHFYVLSDVSGRLLPETWARRAINAYDTFEADAIVYETNQGGEMVADTIRNVCRVDNRAVPRLIPVRATRGKVVRAEPIAALYAQNVVHHVGNFPDLERQLLRFDPNNPNQVSPDRMDALVWGLTELSAGRTPMRIASEAMMRLLGTNFVAQR
jgi:hypothetical protein